MIAYVVCVCVVQYGIFIINNVSKFVVCAKYFLFINFVMFVYWIKPNHLRKLNKLSSIRIINQHSFIHFCEF